MGYCGRKIFQVDLALSLEIHHLTINCSHVATTCWPCLCDLPFNDCLFPCRYYVLALSLETYYPVSPPQPMWAHACYEKIKDLRPKRLPLSDVQMFEMFKKRYGTKQAIKLKVIYLV